VIDAVSANRRQPRIETVPLGESLGRVLAEDVPADRDYPPVARSIRDGFAVRVADLPGSLRIVGEIAAGSTFQGRMGAGECVEIMTGAPVPDGADAIVMVEHTRSEGGLMTTDRKPALAEFINPLGAEARRGAVVLNAGSRISFTGVALLATVGCSRVAVFEPPRVAILSTGNEVVPVDAAPAPYQVRNSNAWAMAAQLARLGADPLILPVAPDDIRRTRELVETGLASDLLLLSGGVSAGKYDYVERVLAELGAEFYFDRVLIQPGQPLVFGRCRNRFFFGLPGNPGSTMITLETIASAAVRLLGGEADAPLWMPYSRITHDFSHKMGLTRFLPALLSNSGTEVTSLRWQGSSDVAATCRANAYLVADSARESWKQGDYIQVLIK
jgi:molybdopterin molybdotransferase